MCEDCGDAFRFDPSGKYSVRYLAEPNPKVSWKEVFVKD